MNAVDDVGEKFLVSSRYYWDVFMVNKQGDVEWVLNVCIQQSLCAVVAKFTIRALTEGTSVSLKTPVSVINMMPVPFNALSPTLR
jgi:hypothetical protein